MLPDRWNPRVWLRDWLNKPTVAEHKRNEAEARFLADLREFQRRGSEDRLREAKRLAAERADQGSTPVRGDA